VADGAMAAVAAAVQEVVVEETTPATSTGSGRLKTITPMMETTKVVPKTETILPEYRGLRATT